MNQLRPNRSNSRSIERTLLIALALVLTVASSLLVLTSATIGQSDVNVVDSDPRLTSLVRRYYHAVNAMLATGDPSALRTVVSDDLLDLDTSAGNLPEQFTLEQHIAFVHSVAPDMRIEPVAIFTRGTTVLAQVAVLPRSNSTHFGLQVDANAALWPRQEEFRVADGAIVERKADWNGLFQLNPSQPITLGDLLSRGNETLTVTVEEFKPGAVVTYTPSSAPLIVWTLSGEIQAHRFDVQESQIELSSLGVPQRGAVGPPGRTWSLDHFDSVLVPAGSTIRLRNNGPDPALALRMSIASSSSISFAKETTGPRIASSVLASTLLQGIAGDLTTSFGEAQLLPGARLTIDSTTELLVVCTTDGTASCTIFDSANQTADTTQFAAPDRQIMAPPLLLVPTESGGTMLMNAGSTSRAVWVLAIAFAGAEEATERAPQV
ncbi:MAG: nuclear transport factor 2 family protein [Thermomicrobiales bacterium]|nr:nuclear transport factor 2 family protein [Thermomicrobiales bacterium]